MTLLSSLICGADLWKPFDEFSSNQYVSETIKAWAFMRYLLICGNAARRN